MVCSLLHTSFLNDTDSMKIKLQHITSRNKSARRHRRFVRSSSLMALVSSLAAVVLLICLVDERPGGVADPTKVAIPATLAISDPVPAANGNTRLVDFRSWVTLGDQLNRNGIYSYSSRLPGLRPIATFSRVWEWLEESFRRDDADNHERQLDGDTGWLLETDPLQQFTHSMQSTFMA